MKSPDVNGWSSCLLTGFKGEVGGATSKEGAFSEHRDVTANRLKAWGVYVETYDSGDKITYNYQMSVAVKDGAVQSGKGTYQATGGTGKMKGIRRRARARTAAALMAQRTIHAPATTHSLDSGNAVSQKDTNLKGQPAWAALSFTSILLPSLA